MFSISCFQFWVLIYSEVGLLDHMVVIFLISKGISILFFTVTEYLTFLPTVYRSSLFSISSSTFVVPCLLDDSHSNWCEVISHCGFDLHFPGG